MTTRTTSKTVTFTKPFVLGDFGETLPAGDYIVETDEELLQGISYPAYLRVVNLVHINHVSAGPGITRTVILPPHELEAALARDREHSAPSASAGRTATERAENEGMLSHAQKGD